MVYVYIPKRSKNCSPSELPPTWNMVCSTVRSNFHFEGCLKVNPVVVCCEIVRSNNSAMTALLIIVETPAPITPSSGKKPIP